MKNKDDTPPKFNIAPEKWWLEAYFPIGKVTFQGLHSGNLNMAMENPPFEDVFPIQDGDFPLLCLFTGGYVKLPEGISVLCLPKETVHKRYLKPKCPSAAGVAM